MRAPDDADDGEETRVHKTGSEVTNIDRPHHIEDPQGPKVPPLPLSMLPFSHQADWQVSTRQHRSLQMRTRVVGANARTKSNRSGAEPSGNKPAICSLWFAIGSPVHHSLSGTFFVCFDASSRLFPLGRALTLRRVGLD